ncbi:FAD-dependent oxidoreductase [candidate division WOR-3 bacterium]|nr:FAD-dependent oxidoreductase [candidate division WOR-3 bacterium]
MDMIQLKNSFILAPVKLGYADKDGIVNQRHIDFYLERSRDMGAVIIEPLYIDKGLREIPTQLGISEDKHIEGLSLLVSSVHKTGAKVIAHLNHQGRMANPKIPGNYFVSSTDKACENGGAVPKRMDKDDMRKAVNLFVSAARRAKEAGFDMIELQFGHGYLLAQFISPFVNDRDDEYGGSFENRIRFPLEVLDAVKKTVDLPIIARISGDEMIPNGIKLPEMIEFSKILESKGVEMIHVSAGSICSTPPWFFQHMFIPKGKTWEMAKEIKNNVKIPVIAVGRINTFEDIETIKNGRYADYIAIGRALVADPEFVSKYLKKAKGIVRPCLACSEGCLGGVKGGKGLQCLVNPAVGYEDEDLEKIEIPKKYAVVGGGVAGMEAAIVMKMRGHDVTIYEKGALGGQFNLAFLPPNKSTLLKLIDYYKEKLKSLDIPVVYKEVDSGELIEKGYDGVVLATGSVPAVPPIKGLKKYYWAEVLKEGMVIENKKVLIIGGGLIGLEVATALLNHNNHIVIVEMLDEVGRGMEAIEKTLILKRFKAGGVEFYLNSRVEEIVGNVVKVKGEKNFEIDAIDDIVLTTGMRSYNPLEEKLKGKLPVYIVGDAKKVGNAQDAIRDAYVTAREIK